MYLSRYLKIYPAKNRPDHFLLYSTLRLSAVILSGAALDHARNGTLPDALRDKLAHLGMLVPDPDIEREQMRGMLDRVNAKSRRFTAMVVLNLDCNLNCGYCYEAEFRDGRYMSDATADLLVEYLLREQITRGFDVELSFYGGEPLMSLDLIRRISLPLKEQAERHGVDYRFSVVTNGTLLNRRCAEELADLGLKGAKFTLDGPKHIHNIERPYASGAGSFDAIVDNIAAIWDLVPIQLGGNFRRENYLHFPRLLDQLIERGITGGMIQSVLFTPVTPKAGCSERSSGCANPSAPWLVDAQLYLREEILKRGFATSKPKVSACIVELENNLLVSCEGEFYKCPALMGWDGFSIGNLTDGIKDYRESHAVGNWRVDSCLECAYLPLCFGGCRFMNLLQDKTVGEVDCRRDYFDAALQVIVEQDLSRAGNPGTARTALSQRAIPSPAPSGAPASAFC
ncbi:geopeptide radical SAM maturase [Geomonas ferrireducens]|uniref:geopeptide radical SAM maturase n=1 Tax=Geomonas ferrireducens TaxID=2570227 RepID=UPI0010A873CA|nr:geopeptide radical SAM maturase [Geomonas ferrireducens]